MKKTPIRAIREQCVTCMGNQYTLIPECPSVKCSLHDYRLGKRPGGDAERTPLRAIRAFCLECVGGENNYSHVTGCSGQMLHTNPCSLHPYRDGHNPSRRGMGGNIHLLSSRTQPHE